jgi:CheY-like chemotaxis protein/HPt (histidine-containing phosphotransfer) domain-containing protein
VTIALQPSTDGSAATGPAKVLVAEDIATNRLLIKRLLERRGHLVTVVNDGRAAVEALGKDSYDVVLLDVQMPGMDGIEATRLIRDPASAVLRHDVPVVAVTAHAMSEDRTRCREAGMDGYLAKPIVATQLYRAVERYAPVAAQGPQDPRERPSDATTAAEQARRRLETRYFGDRELAESIVRTFLEESPRLLKNIRDALLSRDFASLQLHAHSLKSAAATIGLDDLRESALQLEQAARSGSRDTAPQYVRQIENELIRFLG